MSTLIDVAEAVKATLNGASLGQPIVAERAYVVPRDLSDLGTPSVVVAPSLLAVRALDLAPRHSREPEIAVAILERTAGNKAREDALMTLAEGIVDLFATKPLAGTRARNIGVELRPVFDAAAYDAEGVCSTLILLTFRLNR